MDWLTRRNLRERVDAALEALNQAAEAYQPYEYGLPTHDKDASDKMRDILFELIEDTI